MKRQRQGRNRGKKEVFFVPIGLAKKDNASINPVVAKARMKLVGTMIAPNQKETVTEVFGLTDGLKGRMEKTILFSARIEGSELV